MTSDGDILFRVICENPQEDTPRLAYADWLEENGQAERAEFIRLQCEAWNLTPQCSSIHEARTRASELLKRYGDKWYRELPSVPGVEWSSLFVRGFVDMVWVTTSKYAKTSLPAAFAAAPIRYVQTRDHSDALSRELAPFLGRLVSLNGRRPIQTTPVSPAEHKWTPEASVKCVCPA
jgi:uncharacterized protein (TIGR02996 family)